MGEEFHSGKEIYSRKKVSQAEERFRSVRNASQAGKKFLKRDKTF